MKLRIGIVVGTVVALIVGGWGVATMWMGRQSADAKAAATTAEVGGSAEAGEPRRVTLTPAKREAAGIQIVRAAQQVFQHIHELPGRVQYDETRHVAIKAAADGTLQKCAVRPGDRVVPGQELAILSCPEIGTARADVLKRQAELALARQMLEWKTETSRNVQELVAEILRKRTIEQIEEQFRGRSLGDHRQTLLASYARLLLAESMLSSIETATEAGAVAVRTRRERSSERQASEAALRAACEQTEFDAQQDRAAAEAAYQDAQRRLDISRQHVATLLGYDDRPLPDQGEAAGKKVDDTASSSGGNHPMANLSLVECRAPIAGTVESKLVAVTERVRQGDTILVVADTTRLWVVADIRERDWPALDLQPGQAVTLEFPALPDYRCSARVDYCGREVMPGTNAVPLVASVENSDRLLRPGMFVRVSVPIGVGRKALAVPSSSLVEHESRTFVFVEEGNHVFRRVDVKVGERTDEWTEIKEGLAEGAPVAGRGAFVLKSELLLDREE